MAKKRLLGVVGFDMWSAASVEMHVVGEPGFVSKELLFTTFEYPFVTGNLSVVLGRVSSANTEALRFNKHLGFKEVCRIPNAAKDGDLIVMAMQKSECRWLKHDSYLKKVA